ncbi:MAG: Lpg1974 family pore-forming outer membrane protein [Parachlamydiales bacterium]|jgi:hypothetical protein
MNKNNLLNKVLFTIGSVLFASSAFAIPKGPCDVQEVCCEDPAPGPFAFSYPKDVGLSCPRDFYAHGEFLWMKGVEEGLDYAMEQDGTNPKTFPLTVGDIKGFSTGSQEWDWRPGFRLGFGFYSNHDAWAFDLNWTYIKIKANSTASNGSNGQLLPILLPPDTTTFDMPLSSARWSGDYNTLDLGVGKPYHVSRYFVSNPMFGVRAAWIDQDYHVRYFINDLKNNLNLKNDFWGVGLRGSYEGQFLLGSGWYLYGKAAFALLFGKFDVTQHADIVASPLSTYETQNSFYNVVPNAELGFGVCFSKYFNKNQYQVGLKVGYEFHEWWNQNQLRKFYNANPVANDTVSKSNLSFNGFTVGLNVEF